MSRWAPWVAPDETVISKVGRLSTGSHPQSPIAGRVSIRTVCAPALEKRLKGIRLWIWVGGKRRQGTKWIDVLTLRPLISPTCYRRFPYQLAHTI